VKALPCILISGQGYVTCAAFDATHLYINMPGPLGDVHLPVMIGGTRKDTGNWTWNGDVDKPTLKPSIKRTGYIGKNTCYDDGGPGRECVSHVWVNDGVVQYLDDTTHELRGQKLELLDI
jgi:hypothetical protein